ncbi:unnamed protein product [Prorocentrum cordatum]|uniref:Transmembrane protein n=1 Tax=Prorocentrum cordatum TaxID=2364126 RepID=A0ABN9RKA3_9DINO|nr:unnamed protein product [Polarella glacialis]
MLVFPYLCFFCCVVLQPASSLTEVNITCNTQWCHDMSRDCLAGTETQPCSCEKGVSRVIDKLSTGVSPPRYHLFTCCTEGDPYSTRSPARFTFDRGVCGNYSSTHMMRSCFLVVVLFALGATCMEGGRLRRWYVDRPTKRAAEDEDVEKPTNVLDGAQLHNSIAPHKWCVTRADLEQFRRLVRRAVLDGRVTPTEADPFDPIENVIGPCVHTVNDQYIRPVTARAGNPSWALMLHPDGLACDLFITHSWQEGIYELIDKVLNSWPAGKNNAYICFLSNPQNLDIGHLVSKPSDSPFAHALRSATDMMVVSNRRGSIYSRVWCTYEAYLAYTLDKQIFCAASPIHDFWRRVVSHLGVCLVGLSIGAGCWLFLVFCTFDHFATRFRALLMVLLVGAKLFYTIQRKRPSSTACRRSCFVAVLSAGILIGFILQADIMQPMFWVATLLALLFGLCMEADRLWAVVAAREKVNLCLGYTGHVRDAQCSVPEDGELIRGQLQEQYQELAVDQSVECLIRTGLSTRHLRETAQRVGKLGNVTNWYLASVVSQAGGIWVWLPAYSLWDDVCVFDRGISAYVCIFQGISWLVLFAFVVDTDRKAFAARSLDTMLVGLVIWNVSICSFLLTTSLIIGPFVLALTLAGPANVARVPLAGPAVVCFFVGEWGIRSLCARCARHQHPSFRKAFSKELQCSQHVLPEIFGQLCNDLDSPTASRAGTPGGRECVSPQNRRASSCEGGPSTDRQGRSGTLSGHPGELAV